MQVSSPPSFPRPTVIPAPYRHSRAGGNPENLRPIFFIQSFVIMNLVPNLIGDRFRTLVLERLNRISNLRIEPTRRHPVGILYTHNPNLFLLNFPFPLETLTTFPYILIGIIMRFFFDLRLLWKDTRNAGVLIRKPYIHCYHQTRRHQ